MNLFLITILTFFLSPCLSIDRRIVGGDKVKIEDAPYQVALLMNSNFTCGGSLISKTFVLSAAHCTEHRRSSDEFTISAGSNYYTPDKATHIKVEEIFDHPKYNVATADYDFTLLRIEDIPKLPEVVKFIQLPQKHEEVKEGEMMVVVGWGLTQSIFESRDVLRGVDVPIYGMMKCIESGMKYNNSALTDRMICAGYEKGGKDSCSGDSGSSLRRKSDNVLIGVVSFGGVPCGNPKTPAIYAKVSAVLDWIHDVTSINI